MNRNDLVTIIAFGFLLLQFVFDLIMILIKLYKTTITENVLYYLNFIIIIA